MVIRIPMDPNLPGVKDGSGYLGDVQKNQQQSAPAQQAPTNYVDFAQKPVYLGQGRREGGAISADHPRATSESMVDAYMNQQAGFLTLDEPTLKLVAAAANRKGGYVVPQTWWQGTYEDALKKSALLWEKGIKKTPQDILKEWAGGKGLDDGAGPGGSQSRSGGGNGSSGGGGAYSSVTRSVALTNPSSAERLLDATLTNFLGRQATKVEKKAFLQILNSQEKQNPTVTTSAGMSKGGSSSTNSYSTGGVDAAQVAQDYAESRPDYAEYQAATTYMDAFVKALSDPVNI